MNSGERKIGVLHYSAPPVIGGVESVMLTHARLFLEAGYSTLIVAGKGAQEALPPGTEFVHIPELDSQHPQILEISAELEQGRIPAHFDGIVNRLAQTLAPSLESIDVLIVHNVLSKHFNLPLTAALFRLADQAAIHRCVAWCHDITWTSPNSRAKVHEGYPWDLLRTYRSDITYITVSQERQRDLANLFGCPLEQIQLIYNGVEPKELLALSDAGTALIDRLDLWDSDLNLLMPVRVTQAKNVELAIHVIAALRDRAVQAKLVVTGPPDPHDPQSMEYLQSLVDLRQGLALNQQVHFVYESGPIPNEPFIVALPVVADLFRASDVLFMPSHREGFGMPVLEAGLAGMPVFCSDQVPAANEIGGPDVIRFSPTAHPEQIASLILPWSENSPVINLRRRIRRNFTWRSLFRHEILPLLEKDMP